MQRIMACGTHHGFDRNRRSIPLFNFSVQSELNFSFYAPEECTVVYNRTRREEGLLLKGTRQR